MNDRIYRSRDDRILAGVAGGLGDLLNVDPSLVRILWVILLIPTAGFALLLYVVMAFVVPEEPAGDVRWAAAPSGSGPTARGLRPMAFSGPTGPSSSEPIGGATTNGPSTGASGATGATGTSGATGATGPNATTDATAPNASRWGERNQRRLARDERRELRRERRDGTGALVAGLVLILVGGYFLVRTYLPAIDVDRAWPIILIAIGVVLLARSIRGSAGPAA